MSSVPSFEAKLENEEEVLDALLAGLSRNTLDPALWDSLHQAAVRDDRVSELAFAYESISQGRKLKTQLPAVQAELYFRAATFFGDVLGDEFGATTYLERALGASPAHEGAFERIDAQLTRVDDNKKLADLCVHTASHRPKTEQLQLMKRAAVLYERAALDDKAIEAYQALVKLDPQDEGLRNALETRYLKANRFRDVARMLEQALVSEPPPAEDDAARIRAKLIDVFANQLKEPERAMPHVEALLEADPQNEGARRIAMRLLETKALASRAAAALAAGAESTEERARYLSVELENTRGPKRRDVLRRIGILKQDELGDLPGAFEAFEQALGIDPSDDVLRYRYVELGSALKGPLEVARTFARVSTVAKDAGMRSRITAEMGELLLRGGDAKRARTTLSGVLAAPSADPAAVLVAARALAGVYEAEGDRKNLAEVLGRVGELATDDVEKQSANERVAELATETGDVEKAVAAWRRLVDSPARARALAALEPLYEQRSEWIDLSFVLEQRAQDTRDPREARAIAFRAADVLTNRAKDVGSATEAWRQMIERFGPARDVYAEWMPLLEAQRQWVELAEALANDAGLATREEQPPILARLGNVYLTRTRSDDAAIDSFRKALAIDPTEKTSRTTLEKLLVGGEHRLAAATVLEPVYRGEDNGQGLLRVLEIRAQLSPNVQERLEALEEAADVAALGSRDKAVEIIARGLAEAVENRLAVAPWLDRFDRNVEGLDGKRRAQLLGKALGERPIDSPELGALASRVGEEYAAAGDVAAALAALRRALDYDPSSGELLARVDELLKEQGNPEERVALYRAALEQGPDAPRRRKLLHSIGSIERYELGNPDAAIRAYTRALKDEPTDHEAHGALVELYSETEAWDPLCDLLEDHLPHCDSPEETRRTRAQLAEVAARHGDAGRAALHAGALLADALLDATELDLVERVADLLGDNELLAATLGRRVREATDPRVQVTCLERLADLASGIGNRELAMQRLREAAEVARAASDDGVAIQLLYRIRALDPRDAEATRELVELHERAEDYGRLPELFAVLLEVASDVGEKVRILRALGRLYADRLQDAGKAFEAARDAFALGPDDRGALAELEALSLRTNRGPEMAAAVDGALTKIDEGSTWTELVLAKARVLSSSRAAAPDAAVAFRAVLEKAHDEGHVNAAAEGFEAMLRSMSPGVDRVAHSRWLHQWRVDRAPADQRSRALFAWAEAEERELEDPPAALVLYKRVLEVDPDDVDALTALARLSLGAGDIDGALAALEQRRAISEGSAQSALDVEIAGLLAAVPGRASEALERVGRVLESAPQDAAAIELGAKLLANPEVSDRAATMLETSLDAVDDADTKVTILRKLIEASQPRLDLYNRLLDLYGERDQSEEAFLAILTAAHELPHEPTLWDRAEALARQRSSPEPLAILYESVLKGDLPKEQAIELGQRAVAFYEEWFEDGGRVVGILERLLEIEPQDAWTFDRLKLIFDAQERWDDLFALYDRAAADADRDRRIELLEEAAQIAKDFANHSSRAIGYLEQLLELRPGNARLISALERLYERHGCHRELIGLLGSRLGGLPHAEAQKERARIAGMWLDELGDPSSALIVVEDILAHQPEEEPEAVDVTALLERVLAAAPPTAEVRESVAPLEGVPVRRDSYIPMAQKRGLVRQRAAAVLKERYSKAGHEADLARVLEVELEAVKSVKERIRRHQQIAALYMQLGNDERAMEHFVQLVLLEPEVPAHRAELARIAERVGRFEKLADVLVAAADDCNDDALKVELLMHAGVVCAEKIRDDERAIDLFFRILLISPIADAALLEACRHVEPLLERAGKKADRLDVLERLAILEDTSAVRFRVLGDAARLAMELEEDDRAVWAWENRLENSKTEDPEALDGLAFLFEKAAKWRPLIDVLWKRGKLAGRDKGQQRSDRVRVATIQSENLAAAGDAIETWQLIEATFGESEDGTRALSALYRATDRWTDLAELLARAASRDVGSERAEILRELGDVQREQQGTIPEAVASYEAALAVDPRNEGSRSGLTALLSRDDHRAEVVRVLLAAYYAADDWKLVLALTEHRLDATSSLSAQIAILMEAARVSETRAADADAAFALVRRALLLDPGDDVTAGELFRLADLTRAYRSLTDALKECIDSGEKSWSRGLRFRMGNVLELRLDDLRAALDAYVHVAHSDPTDLEAALAVIRVAGRTARWDAAAKAFVESARAIEQLDPSLVHAIEEAASSPGNGWDAVTFAIAQLVLEQELTPGLARDLEAQSAVWHRDRRGDPDAAESTFQRALGHDPTNAEILAELAKLQRRAKGRPLVDSLLRLSQATGGDLDLLTEAADVAIASVGDRALAKSIFDRLLKLAAERWLGATEPNVISGTPQAPDHYVAKATRELVRIHGDDGDHDKVVQLLVDTAHLPWSMAQARALRHEAARTAVDKLGATDRAITIYLGLIAEDPHDADAVANLVALYAGAGRQNELLDLKRRLVRTARSLDERLALRLEVAGLEDRLEEPAKAILALEENLAESPRDVATVERLGKVLEREKKLAPLEALWSSQAELAERDGETSLAADLHALAAVVAEKKIGNVRAAIGHLERVVALETRAASLDDLARLSTNERDHAAAAGYLDRLREAAPENQRADVTLRLAEALVLAGKKAEAQRKLEEEVRRDPEADRVRTRLADMYRLAEAYGELAELLTDGAAHAPDKATRLSRLREAADLHRSRTGDPERAIPLLEQASDLSPEDNGVKLALADAFGAASRFDEARALLRGLVDAFGGRRPKERAPVHYHLALLDLAVGDRARALVELDAATRIDPANPEILRALAELARDDGQLDRAERSYRALLTVLRRLDSAAESAPITRSEVMFELSSIALRQGEVDRAKEILESAFELAVENVIEARRLETALRRANDHANLARALESRLARGGSHVPDRAAIHADLGRLYEEHLKRPAEALAMRLEALGLEPGNDESHVAAQRIAISLGKGPVYEERVRAMASAAETHDPALAGRLFVRLAQMAEVERKDDREAATLYEKAIAVSPSDRAILEAVDRVYERLGDDSGQARVLGLRVALDAAEGGASADALYRLAQLRFRSGSVDPGCDAFEEAFAADPDPERAEALLKLAADAHPTSARLLELYERLARAPGRERSLVDALVRKWALPDSGVHAMREAVDIAQRIEDPALAEELLRRWLESGKEDVEGRVWALSLLATIAEAAGRVREAVLLKREAAELAPPDEARTLLFDVARLASGALDDLKLAATIYEELHERDAIDKDAWSPLLDVYRRMSDYDRLAHLLVEVGGYVDDVQERTKLRLERVRVGMERLRLPDDDAARDLREIVDDDPTAANAAILLGTILERTGREDDLAELLAKQLDGAKDRQDAEAVSSLSRRLGQLLEKRDITQARDVYYTALDWDPKAKEILVALERIHTEEANVEGRADVMERRLALESGPEAERLALDLAALRQSLEDAPAALRALEVGFRASPSSVELRDRLEAVYREQLEYGKLAELWVTDARGRTAPTERAARLRDAARLQRDELADPEAGAVLLREARASSPDDAGLLDELVDMLIASGDVVLAIDELTGAIERAETEALARVHLTGRRGVLRSRVGDAEGALADLETAVANGQLDLRNALADHHGKLGIAAAGRGDVVAWKSHRMRVASLRLATGNIEDARNILTELLKTDSKDRATLRAIAHVDELEERWDQASATYRRLVGLEDATGIVSAALKLAETCEKAGRLGDARGGLERARMAAPEDRALRERLAWLYEQLGAMKELGELVLEEARAAGDVAPRFEGLMRAGQIFLELAQDPAATAQIGLPAAIDPLEEAHALRPSDLDCAALLSDAYVGAGRFDESQELLLKTIGTFKGRRARELSALYHRLARIAEIVGDKTAELQHLTTALDMDAQNGVVASELAGLAMELQSWDVAQRALRAVTMLKAPAPLAKALAYQHLGEIARLQGDVKRAMMLLKRAVDDDPSLESARMLLDQLQAEG